ncbi:methyltransferase domain-containing protein [Paroceanicella profunda]|uniref:Methyltransferase domain-containing protein n=1 Tax=Paroceanicella profunda TaxID=2579971 RepID=A0A5B8FZK2_9RHOB|nr:methyltransferase domain-containing protein [Paroceanicella profunda]QDL91693.1 methyltransferase domain-containing protein [Paroceanicella profunda]
MAGTAFPSGDPHADRRASYAEGLADAGDIPAAIEVLCGALELAPGWAAGWFRLGELHETAGDTDAAARAWDRAVAADPADVLGAGLKRDLARKVPVAEAMPPAFVELLFDQYAAGFERALVGKLGYRGPQILTADLDRAGLHRAARALDLGCGTGLMGQALRPRCDWLGGYDISDRMLAEARRKGVYDLLEKRDISGLALSPARYDLIVAADVFIYLGALERIIAWCAGSLEPSGALAFTLELGSQPVELRESRRFAHSRDYVSGLLADAGFTALSLTECVLRADRGAEVAGLSVVAGAPGTRRDRQGDGAAEVCA